MFKNTDTLSGNTGFVTDTGAQILGGTEKSDARIGTAWSATKQAVLDGFTSDFTLAFPDRTVLSKGEESIAFVIQNHPKEVNAFADAGNVKFNGLRIAFENSSRGPVISVRKGHKEEDILASVDLKRTHGISDFSSIGPSRIRVEYTPGDLDVFFRNDPVISNLDVDLGGLGAVDGAGEAVVGIGSSTGQESAESQVIQRWCFRPTGLGQPASVGSQRFEVETNAAEGTIVGTVEGTHSVPDGLQYSVIGGSGMGVFAVDSLTGVISVANPQQLDVDTTSSFTLDVEVVDSGGLTTTTSVTIELNQPPRVSNQTFEVEENAALGTTVGTFEATHPADNDLHYTVIGGTGMGVFVVDSLTGVIAVADQQQLDFEKTPSFTLDVAVVGPGDLIATARATIDLIDVVQAPIGVVARGQQILHGVGVFDFGIVEQVSTESSVATFRIANIGSAPVVLDSLLLTDAERFELIDVSGGRSAQTSGNISRVLSTEPGEWVELVVRMNTDLIGIFTTLATITAIVEVAPGNSGAVVAGGGTCAEFDFVMTGQVVPQGSPPQVTRVVVSSTGWSNDFLAYLSSEGLGEDGYAIPIGTDAQFDPLPWSDIDKVAIQFSESVDVKQGNLTMISVNDTEYDFANFAYDAVNWTATWTLTAAVTNDKLLLVLIDDVQDDVGNALDGEWVQAVSVISGDGQADGDFQFRLNQLAGDTDQDSVTSVFDLTLLYDNPDEAAGSPDYSILADLNGDAIISSPDAEILRTNLGWQLPDGEPAVASAAAGGSRMSSASISSASVSELRTQRLLHALAAARQTRLDVSTDTLDRSISRYVLREYMGWEYAEGFQAAWQDRDVLIPVGDNALVSARTHRS